MSGTVVTSGAIDFITPLCSFNLPKLGVLIETSWYRCRLELLLQNAMADRIAESSNWKIKNVCGKFLNYCLWNEVDRCISCLSNLLSQKVWRTVRFICWQRLLRRIHLGTCISIARVTSYETKEIIKNGLKSRAGVQRRLWTCNMNNYARLRSA